MDGLLADLREPDQVQCPTTDRALHVARLLELADQFADVPAARAAVVLQVGESGLPVIRLGEQVGQQSARGEGEARIAQGGVGDDGEVRLVRGAVDGHAA